MGKPVEIKSRFYQNLGMRLWRVGNGNAVMCRFCGARTWTATGDLWAWICHHRQECSKLWRETKEVA